jgi:hypothetical protein
MTEGEGSLRMTEGEGSLRMTEGEGLPQNGKKYFGGLTALFQPGQGK